jgi:hypothetical protein
MCELAFTGGEICLSRIFGYAIVGVAAKINIYKTIAKAAVVFGSKKWAMADMDMIRLGTWESKIYGPVVGQGIWRIRTNQELRELYKDLEIVADTKKKRLEWVGHVVRMNQGGTFKKIFE